MPCYDAMTKLVHKAVLIVFFYFWYECTVSLVAELLAIAVKSDMWSMIRLEDGTVPCCAPVLLITVSDFSAASHIGNPGTKEALICMSRGSLLSRAGFMVLKVLFRT